MSKENVVHVNMLNVWHERVEKYKDNDVQTDIAACLNVISGLSTDEGTDDSEMNPAISTVFVSVLLVSHFQWQALPLFSSFLLCLINDLIQNFDMYSVLPIPL
jgi:hypothetical protein